MRLSSFNHIRLLRYAGLFTYICVGIPLIWDSLRAPEVNSGCHALQSGYQVSPSKGLAKE